MQLFNQIHNIWYSKNNQKEKKGAVFLGGAHIFLNSVYDRGIEKSA